MSAPAPKLLLPFVVTAYLGLLAPLVVVIAVSFGPSAASEFPPRGLTLHWFEEFFASQAFVSANQAKSIDGLIQNSRVFFCLNNLRQLMGASAQQHCADRLFAGLNVSRVLVEIEQLGAASHHAQIADCFAAELRVLFRLRQRRDGRAGVRDVLAAAAVRGASGRGRDL